jgi:hypothetical protein
MLALAYLVKHCTVNAKNRVRDPESTEGIMNKEQARPDDLVGRGILNGEVGNAKAENNTAWCNGNMLIFLSF